MGDPNIVHEYNGCDYGNPKALIMHIRSCGKFRVSHAYAILRYEMFRIK